MTTLCHVCDNSADSVCSEADCKRVSCERCMWKCKSCVASICMDCIDECDMCSAPLCSKCTLMADICKCCKQKVPTIAAGTFCVDCTLRDWFGKSGFECNACLSVCNGESCNVTTILRGQKECPICIEPFDENRPYRMQMCDIHKVCTECNYDEARGCPICRVGKAP
jgi:hypothetical protein